MTEPCNHDWHQVYRANIVGGLFDTKMQACRNCDERRPDPEAIRGTSLERAVSD